MSSTHTIYTDLYLLIDEAGSAEAEVTCRVSYTYHPGAPAYTPRGEYEPTEPPEGALIEDVRIEILTDYDGDGQPVWAMLQGTLHDKLAWQFEDKADWLIQEAREAQAA